MAQLRDLIVTGAARFVNGAYFGGASTFGSATRPIWWNNGFPQATTYSLSATLNAGSANRLAYYSGANAVSASSHYASATQVGINITNIDTIGSRALYVNGTSQFSDDIYANKSIRNLAIGGGLYWNPYVESATDNSDVASITLIKSGIAGGTELQIKQANDQNDVINLVAPYYIYLNSKRAFTVNDSWLRINDTSTFTSGIYTGTSLIRTDNKLQVGDAGANFYAKNTGDAFIQKTLGIGGTDIGYTLYVKGKTRFDNLLHFENGIGYTELTTESRRSKNSSNADIETNTGLVTKNKSFIEIRGFAPPTMVRTTGDRPAPYGLGFGNGGESAGIMPIGDGDKLQELMFYGANSGPTLFTWKYQLWEDKNYDADDSNGYSAAMMSLNSKTGDLYVKNTIGINGTNTSYKLYVNGTAYFTGTITATTFNGNASSANRLVSLGRNNNLLIPSADAGTSGASGLVPLTGLAVYEYYAASATGAPTNYGNLLTIRGATSPGATQIALPWEGSKNTAPYIRTHSDWSSEHTWSPWKQLCYTDGSGASGTWNISITGNADTLDGYHESKFLRHRDNIGGSGGTSHSNTLWNQIGIRQYNNALPDALADNATYYYGAVISFPGENSRLDLWYNHQTSSNGDGLRYRTGWNDDKRTWATILDTVNYAGALDGRYVNVAGDTMTGALNFANGTWNKAGDDAQFGDNNTAGSFAIQGINGNTNLKMVTYGNTSYGTITWDGSSFRFSHNIFAQGHVYVGSNNKVHLWEDGEGGNIQIISPDGKEVQMDMYNSQEFRIYSWNDAGTYVGISMRRSDGHFFANAVHSAVWNDYAEYRESDTNEPGYVVFENGDDTLSKTIKRLQHFAGIISDTFGFCEGETEKAKTPLAVAGRVLAYPYQDRDNYKPGDCVCAAPGGTVDIMTRDEIVMYPDRIVGTVSCVPEYEVWGTGNVKVNGRIWIKVK